MSKPKPRPVQIDRAITVTLAMEEDGVAQPTATVRVHVNLDIPAESRKGLERLMNAAMSALMGSIPGIGHLDPSSLPPELAAMLHEPPMPLGPPGPA